MREKKKVFVVASSSSCPPVEAITHKQTFFPPSSSSSPSDNNNNNTTSSDSNIVIRRRGLSRKAGNVNINNNNNNSHKTFIDLEKENNVLEKIEALKSKLNENKLNIGKHYPKTAKTNNSKSILYTKSKRSCLRCFSTTTTTNTFSTCSLANILLLLNLFQFLCLLQQQQHHHHQHQENHNKQNHYFYYKAASAQSLNVYPSQQQQQQQQTTLTTDSLKALLDAANSTNYSLSSHQQHDHHTSLTNAKTTTNNINNNNNNGGPKIEQQQLEELIHYNNNNNNNNNAPQLLDKSKSFINSNITAFNQAQQASTKPIGRALRTINQHNSNSNNNNNNNNHQHHQQQQQHGHAWPHSTSTSSLLSMAEIEDLQDSSIRTRIGDISQATLAFDGLAASYNSPSSSSSLSKNSQAILSQYQDGSFNEFDKLMDRILQQIETRQQQLQEVSSPKEQQFFNNNNDFSMTGSGENKVAADANNKTTMRFFRNNKTFASIVYTNANNDFNNNVRKPRKLINCHLVDLEKHSSDVGVFENKYEIKTYDIEFKEMMQLIEQCTNIARFKPFKAQLFNQQHQLKPHVAQLFASTMTDKNSYAATGSSGHKHSFKPFLIVGRPSSTATTTTTAHRLNGNYNGQIITPQLSYAPGPTLSPTMGFNGHKLATAVVGTTQQQQQQQSIANYHKIMSGALNNELQKLPTIVDDSNKLDLPITNPNQQKQIQKRNYLAESASQYIRNGRIYKEKFAFGAHHNPSIKRPALVAMEKASNLIQKAHDTSKKLVLGEVTPPPSAVDSRQGGIKEAIQEISSYDTSDLLAIWRGILPGTNWCGMGDRATSYNDLGFESDIDICCRAHDFCPIRLSAFSGGYGLFNWSFYTRSHCWCDQNFLDCLQRAQSPLSAVVMKFYFTIMKTTCLHDNETISAYTTPPNSPQFQQQSLLASIEPPIQLPSTQQQQQQQFPNPQRQQQNLQQQQQQQQQQQLQNVNMINDNNLQHQRQPIVQQNNAAQQKLLLDQIRASIPIAALRQSQVVQSKIETNIDNKQPS